MADRMTRKDVDALPIRSYTSTVRPGLRSGDLLFCSGDGIVSKAIRQFTDSPWSHVGVIVRTKDLVPSAPVDRVMVIESVESVGIRMIPVSHYQHAYKHQAPYPGRIVLARHDDVTPGHLRVMMGWAFDQLGRPYDTDQIAKIVARIGLGWVIRDNDREYICSEFAAQMLVQAGISAFFGEHDSYISPADLWLDDRISLLARIW